MFVPYYKPHWQSAFKHEYIFNQAVKHSEDKGHQSWSCGELFCPCGGGAGLESLLQLPQSSVPCAPDCTSPVTVKNKKQGDNADLLILEPLISEGEVFVLS